MQKLKETFLRYQKIKLNLDDTIKISEKLYENKLI